MVCGELEVLGFESSSSSCMGLSNAWKAFICRVLCAYLLACSLLAANVYVELAVNIMWTELHVVIHNVLCFLSSPFAGSVSRVFG